MAEVIGRTGAESAARMTIETVSGEAWDLVAVAAGVRGIGGKLRCC